MASERLNQFVEGASKWICWTEWSGYILCLWKCLPHRCPAVKTAYQEKEHCRKCLPSYPSPQSSTTCQPCRQHTRLATFWAGSDRCSHRTFFSPESQENIPRIKVKLIQFACCLHLSFRKAYDTRLLTPCKQIPQKTRQSVEVFQIQSLCPLAPTTSIISQLPADIWRKVFSNTLSGPA